MVSQYTAYSIVRNPGDRDWTILPGDPATNMGAFIYGLGSSDYALGGDFDDCMSECFSSVSWVNALSFTLCAGTGLAACAAATGGTGVLACAKPILDVCLWVALGAEGAGILACLVKCVKEHL